MRTIKVSDARNLIRRSMQDLGVESKHVGYFEDAMIETSLKGIDTHGIRLLPLYLRELTCGRSKINPTFRFHDNGVPNILQMDADSAAGIVAGYHATEKCISLANKFGIAVISVYNSNHFGAASVYGDFIAKNDLIGLVTTNAAPRVVPFNGSKQLFGTNPICFTAPSLKDEIQFSLDMATSQISYSKVKEYKGLNKELEPNWGVDIEGQPVNHPDKVFALSPVGGYKGQGLSMMVQVLTSLLSGGPFDYEISHLDEEPFSAGRQISHFFLALKIEAFSSLPTFKNRMKDWANYINSSPSKSGCQVMNPGEPEVREKNRRLKNGINLNDVDCKALSSLIEKYNVVLE